MHAGMNHCLAAAAESRWQKSAMMGGSEVETTLFISSNLLKGNIKNVTLLDPGRTLLFTAEISKSNLVAK